MWASPKERAENHQRSNTMVRDHYSKLVLYRVHIVAGTWAYRPRTAKKPPFLSKKINDLAVCTLFAAGAGSTPGAATLLSSNRQAQPDRDAEECFSPSLSHSSSLPESGGRGRRFAFGSVSVCSERVRSGGHVTCDPVIADSLRGTCWRLSRAGVACATAAAPGRQSAPAGPCR